ncbi:hypothetical protein [Psychrobacter aestuarii]|uniref:Uncharacterized protein n=1 Tax=Psychrobacter aestuarii TaxID=556327 RepID=A0ABP3FGV0_9GAMM|nr:hypothetical protein [Psychrobacter aestuarii]
MADINERLDNKNHRPRGLKCTVNQDINTVFAVSVSRFACLSYSFFLFSRHKKLTMMVSFFIVVDNQL